MSSTVSAILSATPTPERVINGLNWTFDDLYNILPQWVKDWILNKQLGVFNFATVSLIVGGIVVLKFLASVIALLYTMFLTSKTNYITKYKAGYGAWAVVTGASQGIGREFALQLAEKKFNIFLLARNKEKLDELARDIQQAYNVEVIVHPFDFAEADDEDWDKLEDTLLANDREITILVNNVGINQPYPNPFAEEDPDLLTSIVTVNCTAQVRITRIIFPEMVRRHKGLILNVGSVAGLFPNAFLAVYSGTKAFLRNWSRALALEGEAMGVEVQHVKTYYVSTAMSKMKPTSLAPTPEAYVRKVLATGGAFEDDAPYPQHMAFTWAIDNILPEGALMQKAYELNIGIRQRALARKKRLEEAEATAAKKE
ncbi:hypothetical protein HK097_004149 [Rhizophlyctis rosea]|uniref:Very-long-chain 3-oxoacyl-CoA reductase n=1 Tax=Rhizophlyctis rosea TaxID=64517 RepID=A0AAD5SF28_9FUNG|nr:hypothetical protein HK097_004149 [Rhizophlyctis rosea]